MDILQLFPHYEYTTIYNKFFETRTKQNKNITLENNHTVGYERSEGQLVVATAVIAFPFMVQVVVYYTVF
jgi:hypothetical protein